MIQVPSRRGVSGCTQMCGGLKSLAEALDLMTGSRTLKVSSRPRATDPRQMSGMVEELTACLAFLLRVNSSPSLPLLALLSELRP